MSDPLAPPPEAAPVVAAPRRERFALGLLLALVMLPVGVIGWVLLRDLGWVSAVVGVVVVAATPALYRLGSGGAIGLRGAIAVGIITVVTIALGATIAVVDTTYRIYGVQHGLSTLEAFGDSGFWAAVGRGFGRPDVLIPLLVGLGIAAVAAFSLVRAAVAAAAPAEPRPPAGPASP